jgi:diguanylate cyclase (GGDEF)-like protein
MLHAVPLGAAPLDTPTIFFVAICIAGFLGLFLIFAWLQERDTRALAWWGSAYLLGASSLALWNAPAPLLPVSPAVAGALMFVACGMVWNGVRLFHGRRALVMPTFAGAAIWLALSQAHGFNDSEATRAIAGAIIIALYTFSIAFELWRERRRSLRSRFAGIAVPLLHEAIFLSPVLMKVALPEEMSRGWLDVLAIETIIYSIGTAFLVLIMVKDREVRIQRTAASTDPLTGLLNRRAFLESARALAAREQKAGRPVSLLMFDLDRFKSINDTCGHAAGDEALKAFAASVRNSMRLDDIIGRLGGEEFAAIVDAGAADTVKIAERVRAGFERDGRVIAGQAIGATVSVGAATATANVDAIEKLLARADSALYRAKTGGRNRVEVAGPSTEAEQAGANSGKDTDFAGTLEPLPVRVAVSSTAA